MARDQSRRLKTTIFQADENGYIALQAIKAYSPANPAFSLEAVVATRIEVESLRRNEAQALAIATNARYAAVAKEWEFHNLMLGVKTQIVAQFGIDSD